MVKLAILDKELTLDEAKELYEVLDKLFGTPKSNTWSPYWWIGTNPPTCPPYTITYSD